MNDLTRIKVQVHFRTAHDGLDHIETRLGESRERLNFGHLITFRATHGDQHTLEFSARDVVLALQGQDITPAEHPPLTPIGPGWVMRGGVYVRGTADPYVPEWARPLT